MNEVIRSLSIAELDEQVAEHWADQQRHLAAAEPHVRRAVEATWKLGQHLAERKRQTPHGEWLPYLERVGVPRRRASGAMRIAANYTTAADLPPTMRAALAALGTPQMGNVAHLTPPPDDTEVWEAAGDAEPAELPESKPKPKQELLTDKDDDEPATLTRTDRLLVERDEAMQEAAEARQRAAEAERQAEIAERRAEAAEATGEHAQVAGAKIKQSENRADRMGYDLTMAKSQANELRNRLASKTRELGNLRRALEELARGDELLAGALEPVMVKFFGARGCRTSGFSGTGRTPPKRAAANGHSPTPCRAAQARDS